MKKWIDTRHLPQHCPECDYKLDTASARGATPKPGDFSVCINCAAVLCFDKDLKLRLSTIKERSKAGPELEHVVEAVLTVRKFRSPS